MPRRAHLGEETVGLAKLALARGGVAAPARQLGALDDDQRPVALRPGRVHERQRSLELFRDRRVLARLLPGQERLGQAEACADLRDAESEELSALDGFPTERTGLRGA